MRYSAVTLMAAGLVSAAPTAPGGAIPGGIMVPDTTGFTNPVVYPSRGGHAICVSGSFPVEASTSENLKFNFKVPQNRTSLIQAVVGFITPSPPGSAFLDLITEGKQNASGTYQISGSLCGPANSTTNQLQFLTHGVGFDRYYWDFAPGYSYVDVAADNGYATFLYDRLGVGLSDKPDPLNVVQGPLEVEIANQIAQQLRGGKLGGRSFRRIVGAGHSFGSLVTQSVTSKYPQTFDSAILTGFSTNLTGFPAFATGLNPDIAAENQPYRFAGLDPGYIIAGDTAGNQLSFFHFTGFDPAIVEEANAQKGSFTYGELFTQGLLVAPAPNFTGPVAVVDGLGDLAFCFGNCTYPVSKGQAALTTLYTMASSSSTTYYAHNTGHGINLHYSATSVFKWIQKFISSNSS